MEKLEAVLRYYQNNHVVADGVYYDLKCYDSGIYSLQKNISGYCGEKLPHPAIKFQVLENRIVFIHYADFVETPLRQEVYNDSKSLLFQSVFEQLVEEFYQVIPVV